MPKHLAYTLLCVIVPGTWGLIVYWASTMIEWRALRSPRSPNGEDGENALPLDYHI